MSLTIHLPGRVATAPAGGAVDLAGPSDLPESADAALVCAECQVATTLSGEAVFQTDWDDDLTVHELHFEVSARGACAGCGAAIAVTAPLIVYRDRATGRRWLEIGLASVRGGELGA